MPEEYTRPPATLPPRCPLCYTARDEEQPPRLLHRAWTPLASRSPARDAASVRATRAGRRRGAHLPRSLGAPGKVVTLITGLPAKDLESRATLLKRLCGAGGAVKAGAVEIQGDHRERIADTLKQLGHRVKLAGG